jgi:Holliday junction resolvasome RuvABC endonuclease subunit
MVLSFDPSLSNTGWVEIVRLGPEVRVRCKGTLRPRTVSDGYLGTWEKYRILDTELNQLLTLFDLTARSGRRIVWEAPPVGPASRPESSLMAGCALWQRFHHRKDSAVMSAQHASSVIVGNPRHDKAEVKLAVARYVPESAGRTWNEHERDALLLAITELADLASRKNSK